MQKSLAGMGVLNIPPAFLIVPIALETKAGQVQAEITPSTPEDMAPAWTQP